MHVHTLLALPFSVDGLLWSDFPVVLSHLNHEIQRVQGDGFCFINSVVVALNANSIPATFEDVKHMIMREVETNLTFYGHFVHGMRPTDVHNRVTAFFNSAAYTDEIVDVIVGASANALSANMHIYSYDTEGRIRVSLYKSALPTALNVLLLFSVTPGSHNNLDGHYSPIVPSVQPLEDDDQGLYIPPDFGDDQEFQGSTPLPTYTDVDSVPRDVWVSGLDAQPATHNRKSNNLSSRLWEAQPSVHPAMFMMESLPKPSNRALGGRQFGYGPYLGVVPTEVHSVPASAPENAMFFIRCTGTDYRDRLRDGRLWAENPSGMKGRPAAIRKRGLCRGDLVCTNPACPRIKMLQDQGFPIRPRSAVQRCPSCQELASPRLCSAMRIWEYYDVGVLIVLLQGVHTCGSISGLGYEDRIRRDSIIQEAVQLAPHTRPADLQNGIIQHYLAEGRVEDASQAARLLADSRYVAKKKHSLVENRYPGGRHSFKAIAFLKQTTDRVDEFHIYDWNDGLRQPDQPLFVFKSSRLMAQVALQMDSNVFGEHPMNEEYVFMDAMHARVRDYKTVTLWTYSSLTKGLLRLATMECKKEDSANLTLFLSKFLEILRAVAGQPTYVWRPRGFLFDASGANFNAVRNVLGEEMVARSSSCQWHFLRDAQRAMKKISHDYQSTFVSLVKDLIAASTQEELTRVSSSLEQLVERDENKRATPWLKWWFARRWHLVPLLRGFDVPGCNPAESGHSTLKAKRSLMLVDAAYRDTGTMMIQEEIFKSVVAGVTLITKHINQDRYLGRQHEVQLSRAKQYLRVLEAGDVWLEENLDKNRSTGKLSSAVPTEKASYKAPSTFCEDNDVQILGSSFPLQQGSALPFVPDDEDSPLPPPIDIDTPKQATVPRLDIRRVAPKRPPVSQGLATGLPGTPVPKKIIILRPNKGATGTSEGQKKVLVSASQLQRVPSQGATGTGEGQKKVVVSASQLRRVPIGGGINISQGGSKVNIVRCKPNLQEANKENIATSTSHFVNTQPAQVISDNTIRVPNVQVPHPRRTAVVPTPTGSGVRMLQPPQTRASGTWTSRQVPAVAVKQARPEANPGRIVAPPGQFPFASPRSITSQQGSGFVQASKVQRRQKTSASGLATMPSEDSAPLSRNPPTVVLLPNIVKKCYGCSKPFAAKYRNVPENLTITMMLRRTRPDGKGGWMTNSLPSPTYFHANSMFCVQRRVRYLELHHLYMNNDTFSSLTPAHRALLQRRNMWDGILANRAKAARGEVEGAYA